MEKKLEPVTVFHEKKTRRFVYIKNKFEEI